MSATEPPFTSDDEMADAIKYLAERVPVPTTEPPFDCHEAVMAVLAAHTIECTDSSNGTVTCRCRSTVTEWMTWSDHRRHVANVLIANRLIVRDGD